MSFRFSTGAASRLGAATRACLPSILALVLAACGGGGGGSGSSPTPPPPVETPTVSGIVANGAAMSGIVELVDSRGSTQSMDINGASGQFSFSVKGMSAPFMLKAVNPQGAGLVLYSAALGPGRANITPLTTLALMPLAPAQSTGPGQLFLLYGNPSQFSSVLTSATLTAAARRGLSRLLPSFVSGLPGTTADGTATYDPFTTPYAIGDAVDRLIDANPIAIADGPNLGDVVTQRDGISGRTFTIANDATINAAPLTLTLRSDDNGVAGSTVALSAIAAFDDGVSHDVPAQWTITSGGGSVDSGGQLTLPASTTAGSVTLHARWSDGAGHVLQGDRTVGVLPAVRPVSVDLTGVPSGAATPDTTYALSANVHWADGSVTHPVVAWTWDGDASAVQSLASDGTLRTGHPSADQDITVAASFTANGVSVQGQAAIHEARFVRHAVSTSIVGLGASTELMSGETRNLSLHVRFNDGSEANVFATSWSIGSSTAMRVPASINSSGQLYTTATWVPTGASLDQRTPDNDVITSTYVDDNGGWTTTTQAITVRPLLDKPVSLAILGPASVPEASTAGFLAEVTYADGSTRVQSAAWTTSDPTLLASTGDGTMQAGTYANQPAQNGVATIGATWSLPYTGDDGQPTTLTLTASAAITVNWVAPTLRWFTLPADFEFLLPGTPVTPVATGQFSRLGNWFTAPVDVSFTTTSARLTASGPTVTATSAPTTPGESWATVTATAHDPSGGPDQTVKRTLTIDFVGMMPKHLLAAAWGPDDYDVQFRAISSDGHVDEYTVARLLPFVQGEDQPATRRRLAYFSGVSAFVQNDPAYGDQTTYVAAIVHGRVVVLRHADLNPDTGARPAVLPGIYNAKDVAFAATAGTGAPEAGVIRLYVRAGSGVITEYALNAYANAPITDADLVLERTLPGTWASLAGGRQRVVMRGTDGTAMAEGYDYPDLGTGPGPGGSSVHWDAPQLLQRSLDYMGNSYTPLTGVVGTWASFDTTMAMSGNCLYLAGTAASIWSWPGMSCNVTLAGMPRSVSLGVVVQADGSVLYLAGFFFLPESLDQIGGNFQQWQTMTGLPEIVEAVDPRRDVAWTPNIRQWETLDDDIAGDMMPILRTADDRLFYLNGSPILDASGQPVVLP